MRMKMRMRPSGRTTIRTLETATTTTAHTDTPYVCFWAAASSWDWLSEAGRAVHVRW